MLLICLLDSLNIYPLAMSSCPFTIIQYLFFVVRDIERRLITHYRVKMSAGFFMCMGTTGSTHYYVFSHFHVIYPHSKEFIIADLSLIKIRLALTRQGLYCISIIYLAALTATCL